MCGICGALGFPDALTLVQRMNDSMIHRGPDSDGTLDDGSLALGMRRLSIIDLDTGDQPIYNEDRTVAVLLNGEIYNFQELYRELTRLGHTFASRSDTETIVHAYEQWGIEALDRLRGMFALAIWDRRPRDGHEPQSNARRVLLARDRLGVKPLYLWQDRGQLLFASEVRALLASGVIPRRLATAGLYTFLLMGSVQEPLTMIEGIASLPPGSWLQATWNGGHWRQARGTYWEPPEAENSAPKPSLVRTWLADAVQSRLISDVPLGSFLSGGLDSGTIVALGSQALDKPMRTFTLAFDNWPDDEREDATRTARRHKTDHQTRVISQRQVLADLPAALAAMDQPSIDGINTWYVSREARRAGLTVALSGIGGDELFAGYPSFRQVPGLKRIKRLTRGLSKTWASGRALDWLSTGSDRSRKIGDLLRGQTPFDHPYFAVRGLFPSIQASRLLQSSLGSAPSATDQGLNTWAAAVRAELDISERYDAVGETSWLELSQYMRSTLLRDADAMSMAHSLEVRVPLADHVLVERILPVKAHLKQDGRRPKPLLAQALGDLLPPAIVTKAKRTFTLPFGRWLRESLADTVVHSLKQPSDAMAAWLHPTELCRVWSQFEGGQTNWARPWSLYVLDAWLQRNA